MGCKPRFTKEQAEEIRKLYREQGLTITEIARRYKANFQAVANAIKFIENGYYTKAEEKAKAEAAEMKAKQEASKKLREAAEKRMEQTRQKHKALLDVIFEFCLHEIPYTGCPNCPLCPAKLGFDVCGGVNLTTVRLQKAIEAINKYREVQRNEN